MGSDLEEFCWGTKEKLIEETFLIVDRLFIRQGGYSSIHYHKYQQNRMIVIAGMLDIEYYTTNNKLMNTDCLLENGSIVIPNNTIHRFKGKSITCEVIEVVTCDWSEMTPVTRDDIVRLTERGIDNDKT